MNAVFGCIFLIFFFVITYPVAKNFQLCGYDITYFFKHFFAFSYYFCGKNRLIFTKRMIRLVMLYAVLLSAITLSYFLLMTNFWLISLFAIVEFVLLPLIFLLSAAILQPIENAIKGRYLKKAKQKLNVFGGMKIAITGSFGKTTTKNFLVQILQTKYKVCATPKNYNTPMGLCKTALENLKPDDQILVVEMGARHKGDIAELMDMLQPTHGILTAVGQQHLESFGDLQTILSTKNELCEHMRTGGKIVFDCSNENTQKLYERYSGEKIATSVAGGVLFSDVKYSKSGCQCKLNLDGSEHNITLKIIGKEMLKDLACAVAMASIVGVSEQQILKILPALKPAPHRLELISSPHCTIIDDSYNSNLAGAMQVCECVQLFDGKRIIISPGLVEQGEKQYELNFAFGKTVGRSCDEFIIMNETNKKALYEGAIAAGMSEKNIHFAQNRKQQSEILQEIQQTGSIVLFENDLPDNYR